MCDYWIVLLAPFLLLLPVLGRGQALFWGTPSLQFIPWWVTAVNGLKQGVLPLWNPLNGMGAPLLANYQMAFFYPPNWILIPFGIVAGAPGIALGYTLLTGVHLAWAGLGMALLVKKLGFSRFAQIISGIAFGLSGYIIARLSFFSMTWAAAWFPWVIFSLDQIINMAGPPTGKSQPGVQEAPIRFPFFLSFCLAMQLLAGHAQLAWYTFIFAGVWGVVGLFKLRSRKQFILTSGWAVLAVLGAVCIAAVQLVPTYQYLSLSQRADAYAYTEAMMYSFWPWRLVTLFSPDFFGSPAQGNYWGYASYWEDHLYLGIIPLALALTTLGLLLRRNSNTEAGSQRYLLWVCWGMTLVSFVLGLGSNTPVFPFLYNRAPTFNMFQAPARMLIWAAFCLPLLAAVGIDHWRCPSGKGLYWLRLGTAGAFAITLGAGLSFWLVENIRLTFVRATAITGVWILSFGVMTLLLPWAATPSRKKIWQGSVILICLADLLFTGWGLNPGIGLSFFTPKQNEPFQSLSNGTRTYLSLENENELKFRRFYRFNSFLPNESWEIVYQTLLPDLNLFFGIPSVNNFDPLVTARYQSWMTAINRLSPQARSGWLAFLNVGWVEEIDLRTKSGVRFDPITAMGWWQWYSCAQPVKDQKEAWEYLKLEMRSSPSPDRRVLLELPDAGSRPLCQENAPARIEVLGEKPDQISFSVEAGEPGWLEWKESWYPGWQVEVSGEPARLVIADGIFQSVRVPAGAHTVTFFYRPRGFYSAGLFSILVLFLLMFLWIRKGR